MAIRTVHFFVYSTKQLYLCILPMACKGHWVEMTDYFGQIFHLAAPKFFRHSFKVSASALCVVHPENPIHLTKAPNDEQAKHTQLVRSSGWLWSRHPAHCFHCHLRVL